MERGLKTTLCPARLGSPSPDLAGRSGEVFALPTALIDHELDPTDKPWEALSGEIRVVTPNPSTALPAKAGTHGGWLRGSTALGPDFHQKCGNEAPTLNLFRFAFAGGLWLALGRFVLDIFEGQFVLLLVVANLHRTAFCELSEQ